MEVCGFSVEVVRRAQRRAYLRVGGGCVRVSCPPRMTDGEVASFVTSHRDWIARRLAAERLRGFSRDGVALWGREMSVKFVDARPWGAFVDGDAVVIRAPEGVSDKEAEALFNGLLRRELSKVAASFMARWQGNLGVSPEGFHLRDMRGRWGSCSMRSRRLCFNLQLAHWPVRCTEYVVVHELCHLLVADHSSAFWDLVGSCLPDWKERRARLNDEPAGE